MQEMLPLPMLHSWQSPHLIPPATGSQQSTCSWQEESWWHKSLPDLQLREAEQMAGKGDRVKSKHPQSNEQSPWTKCEYLSSRSAFQVHAGLLDTTTIINRI